jgi:hypothetical protein
MARRSRTLATPDRTGRTRAAVVLAHRHLPALPAAVPVRLHRQAAVRAGDLPVVRHLGAHGALEAFHDRTLFGMPSEEDLLGLPVRRLGRQRVRPRRPGRPGARVPARAGRAASLPPARAGRPTARRQRPRSGSRFPSATTPPSSAASTASTWTTTAPTTWSTTRRASSGTASRCAARCSWRSTRWPASTCTGCSPPPCLLDFVVPGTEVRVPLEELDLDAARQRGRPDGTGDHGPGVRTDTQPPVRLVRPPRPVPGVGGTGTGRARAGRRGAAGRSPCRTACRSGRARPGSRRRTRPRRSCWSRAWTRSSRYQPTPTSTRLATAALTTRTHRRSDVDRP